MTRPNRIYPADLLKMEVSDIAALPVEELAILQDEIGERLTAAKTLKDRFDTVLDRRFGQRARGVRASHNKDTGTIHFDDGPVTITADLPKRVKWDQGQLGDIRARISLEGEDPDEFITTAYKVSERRYTAWPQYIRDIFAPARTVETGKPTIRLSLKNEAIK